MTLNERMLEKVEAGGGGGGVMQPFFSNLSFLPIRDSLGHTGHMTVAVVCPEGIQCTCSFLSL